MSAEQRSPDRAPSSRIRPHDGNPTGVTILHPARTPADATNRTAPDPGTLVPRLGAVDQQPLSQQIERTQLEATIAALERELRASERRRQSVIDQYERVLERRESGDEGTTSSTNARVSSGVRRLLEFGWR